MRKTKQNLFTFIFVFGIIMSFPTIAHGAETKNSSIYSFTMNRRIVDGSLNGEYHYLEKGEVYINGEHGIKSTDVGASPDKACEISYSLIRSRVGFDIECGTYTCSVNEKVSGFLGMADETSDKYYLQIFKIVDDGNNIVGDGEIINYPN